MNYLYLVGYLAVTSVLIGYVMNSIDAAEAPRDED
jgi:hypothetical protein